MTYEVKYWIVLRVIPTRGNPGELQRFEYIEGDRFMTRKAALRAAETARMRWSNNYAQFRDAKFAITDTAEIDGGLVPTAKKKVQEPRSYSQAVKALILGSKPATRQRNAYRLAAGLPQIAEG